MSRAIWIVAILCALAVIAGALGGPSDTEAAQDAALDLRDAQQQARAEIHHAQALALLAARSHK